MGMDQTLIGFAVTKGGDIANEVWNDCGSIENPIGMAVALGQATGTILRETRNTLDISCRPLVRPMESVLTMSEYSRPFRN